MIINNVKNRFMPIITAICILLTAIPIGQAVFAETNLITNGDFEEYDEQQNKFNGWTFYTNSPSTHTFSNGKGRNGGNSALITAINTDRIPTVSQTFDIDSTKSYRIIAYIKTASGENADWVTPTWANGVFMQLSATGMTDVKSESIKSAGRWQRISFVVDEADIPDSVSKATLTLRAEYSRGLIYLDDVSVVEYNGEPLEPEVMEDIYNTGFEETNGSLFEDWTKVTSGFATVSINPTDDAYEGETAAKVSSEDKNRIANINQKINNVDSTKRYLLSCYVKTDVLELAYTGGGVKLRIEYKNAQGVTQNITSSGGVKDLADWTQLKLYYQIPEGATDVTVYLLTDCVKGNVFFDAVNISVIGDAVVKKQGSFANSGFELFEEGTFPEWSFWNGSNPDNTITQVEGRNGKAVKIRDNDNARVLKFSQSIDLDTEKIYRISMYVRATSDDVTDWALVSSWGDTYLQFVAGDYVVKSDSIRVTGPWKKISIIVDASLIPENTTGQVDFVMQGMRGIILLDDAQIVEYDGIPETPEKYEPLYNLGFEEGENNSFEYWSKSGSVTAKVISSDKARSGKRAAQFVSEKNSSVYNLTQGLNSLDSAKRYVFTAFVKTDELSMSYTGGGVKLRVEYIDSNGTKQIITSSPLHSADDWTQLNLTFQLPQGAVNPCAIVMIDCVKGNVWVDDTAIAVAGDAIVKETGSFANGDFELFEDGAFPEWSFWNGSNSANTVTQETGRNGKAAVIRDNDNARVLKFSQSVDLDKEKIYRISMYIRATSDDATDWALVSSWGDAYLQFVAGDYVVKSDSILVTGPWKKVSIIVDANKIPENTTGQVDFIMQGMRGIIMLDDAQIVEYDGTDEEPEIFEHLYNIGFEEGKKDSFEYWSKSGSVTAKVISSDKARNGKRAAQFVSEKNSSVYNLTQGLNSLDVSKRYLFTAYVKTDELSMSYTGGGVKLRVQYTDSDGANQIVNSGVIHGADDWTQLKVTFQLPEGAVNPCAIVMIDCVKGNVWVDDVAIAVVGEAVEKKFGNFANADFEEYYEGEFPEWSFYNAGIEKNTLTSGEGKNGKAAVMTATDWNRIIYLNQSVSLDREKVYKISMYVRCSANDDIGADWNAPDWGGVYLQFKAGDYTAVSETLRSTGPWRKLSVIVDGTKIPENATTLSVSLMMQYMRGVVFADNASIVEYDGTPDEEEIFENLYNLSFEEGLGSTIEYWNKWPGRNASVSATDIAYDGKRAVELAGTDKGAISRIWQSINNWDPTLRYKVTVYAKNLDDLELSYQGGGMKIRVSYVDKDGKTQTATSMGKKELDDWTQLYLVYQIPEGATDVRLILMTDCVKGRTVFDKVELSVVGKAVVMPVRDEANIAPNFSFEDGQDGSFTGWYWWSRNSQVCTCHTGEPRTGAQSAKMVSTSTNCTGQLSWDVATLDTTQYYQFTAWVKTEDVVPLAPGEGGAMISINFKGEENATIKRYASKMLVEDNGWTQLQVIGRFPQNCTRVIFALTLSQASGTVYWDDVDIRVVEYVDRNLLKNSKFDEVDDNGNLLYWEKESDDWSFGGFSAEENVAKVNNEGFCTSYYYQEIKGLEYDQEYVLSGSVKSSYVVSDNGGVAAMVQFYDVYGNLIETKSCNEYLTDTSDGWNDFSVKLNFPDGCDTMRVLLAGVKMVGVAEFSDFSLYSIQDYSGATDEVTSAVKSTVFNKAFEKKIAYKQMENKGLSLILIAVGGSVIIAVVVTLIILIHKKKSKIKG